MQGYPKKDRLLSTTKAAVNVTTILLTKDIVFIQITQKIKVLLYGKFFGETIVTNYL